MKNERMVSIAIGLGAALAIIGSLGYAVATSSGGSEQSGADRPAAEVSSIAPSSQQAALTDGVITWDEHEGAIKQVASCLSDLGVAVEVRPAVGRRPTDVGFAAKTIQEGEQIRVELLRCQETYLNAIEKVWQGQTRPSAEQEQTMSSWLFKCVEDQGFALTSKTVLAVVDMLNKGSQEEHQAAAICFQREKETFGTTS